MNAQKLIEESNIEEFVRDMISSARIAPVIVENARYHHNTRYENAPFNIRNGLMSTNNLIKCGRISLPKETLWALENDEYSANGIDYISLSVVGLNDQYREDEWEYNPLKGSMPDILISSDIKTRRYWKNNFNEFLAEGIILPEKFRSVDTRLIKVCNNEDKIRVWSSREERINELKEMYNQLSEIALAMKEIGLDIPLREMSYEDDVALDIDKVSKFPKIRLIKK